MGKNFVISFPKCGRTWLRILMGKSICSQYGINDKKCINIPIHKPHLKQYPIFRHSIVPNNTIHIASKDSWTTLTKNIDKFEGKRVAFLVRNPLDVMVSYWCHRHYRNKKDPFKENISRFIRTDYYGIDKLLFYWNLWNDNKGILDGFHLIKYEDIHKNALAEVRNIFDFFDMKGIRNDHIQAAVDFAKFENLKKKQDQGYFPNKEMKPIGSKHPDGQKVRKGRVKGYREYLSEDDIKYVKERMRSVGCPFYKPKEV